MDIGKEDAPFVAEPIEDPFTREIPADPAEADTIEVTEEPLVPVGA